MKMELERSLNMCFDDLDGRNEFGRRPVCCGPDGGRGGTVDRAAEAPEMAVRMVVGQADGDRIHGDQAVVAQADLVQWDLQDHGDHRDFPDTRGPRVRQEPPGRPVPKGRQERQELQDRRGHRVR